MKANQPTQTTGYRVWWATFAYDKMRRVSAGESKTKRHEGRKMRIALVGLLIAVGLCSGCSTMKQTAFNGSSEKSETVIRVSATADCVPTGIKVNAGDVLHFDSKEQKWSAGGALLTGTDGLEGTPSKEELPVAVEGGKFAELAGSVGSWKFLIGSANTITMIRSGELCLFMNDRVRCYGDNSGAVEVIITRARQK